MAVILLLGVSRSDWMQMRKNKQIMEALRNLAMLVRLLARYFQVGEA